MTNAKTTSSNCDSKDFDGWMHLVKAKKMIPRKFTYN